MKKADIGAKIIYAVKVLTKGIIYMALVTLKDVGKIYVSEGNVAVGIRDVNLSFDRGEFVAITGKSGSGKSTLLNVISGMDSYEEGELYINGEPTSHYLQSDWEEYRKKYISFIFQDYNIVESFTVLQNVELALMHIDNSRERRKQAIALIKRVGLESHMKHKGSQLSGGQKQRTVIARALAKNSPILLADEPTGNLDSKTSKEIIELLREISHEKLVIVVTHNFDEVEEHATRHIRIFDGSVDSDQTLIKGTAIQGSLKPDENTNTDGRFLHNIKHNLKKGMLLGKIRFTSKPKLSAFICIVMCIATLVSAIVTASSGDIASLFEKSTLFTPYDGRVVIMRKDGEIISSEELESLREKVGADKALQYDYLLDYSCRRYDFGIECETDVGKPDVGRYPESANEVLLYLPIYKQSEYGKDEISQDRKYIGNILPADYEVVGIKYFYDNTKKSKIIMTEEGYNVATVLAYMQNKKYGSEILLNSSHSIFGYDVFVSFELPEKTYTIYESKLGYVGEWMNNDGGKNTSIAVSLNISPYASEDIYIEDEIYFEGSVSSSTDGETVIEYSLDKCNFDGVVNFVNAISTTEASVIVSSDIITDFIYNNCFDKIYTQASLFFESDWKAKEKISDLDELGYTAVLSSTEQAQSDVTRLLTLIVAFFALVSWVVSIVFIGLFLNLCTSKAMLSSSGDVAIMRSMGIPVKIIKISIYIQTMISIIPSTLVCAVVLTLIYTNPKTNGLFTFLHLWQYVLLFIGIFIITYRASKKYVKKIFGKSVKKTLIGGVDND